MDRRGHPGRHRRAAAVHHRLPVDVPGLLRPRASPTSRSGRAWTGSRARSCTRSSGRDDLDLAGKRVVVIGSGSTAATLIPAIAKKAAHVTMLQRSPVLLPRAADHPRARRHAARARRPARSGRTRSCAAQYSAQFHGWPGRRSRRPTSCTSSSSRRSGRCCPRASTSRSTSPRATGPWQQRIAIVPEGDLFAALREGKASIVTDTIEDLHRDGHPGQLRRGARGRRRRHRHRASTCRCSATSPFTVDGEPVDFTAARHLARHHDQRRAEHGLRVRLLPAQLDAARGPRQRPGDAADRAHGSDKGATIVVPTLRPRGRRHAAAARGRTRRTSTPATSCARSTCCSSRATASRGPTCWSTPRRRELLPKADLDDGSLVYR